MKIFKTNLNDVYYEIFNKLVLRYNTLVPNGKFSSLCLKPYDKKIDSSNMDLNPSIINGVKIVNKRAPHSFFDSCNELTLKSSMFM